MDRGKDPDRPFNSKLNDLTSSPSSPANVVSPSPINVVSGSKRMRSRSPSPKKYRKYIPSPAGKKSPSKKPRIIYVYSKSEDEGSDSNDDSYGSGSDFDGDDVERVNIPNPDSFINAKIPAGVGLGKQSPDYSSKSKGKRRNSKKSIKSGKSQPFRRSKSQTNRGKTKVKLEDNVVDGGKSKDKDKRDIVFDNSEEDETYDDKEDHEELWGVIEDANKRLRVYTTVHRQLALFLKKMVSPWYEFASMYCGAMGAMGSSISPDDLLKIYPEDFHAHSLWQPNIKSQYVSNDREMKKLLDDILQHTATVSKGLKGLTSIFSQNGDPNKNFDSLKTTFNSVTENNVDNKEYVEEILKTIMGKKEWSESDNISNLQNMHYSREFAKKAISKELSEEITMFLEPKFRGLMMIGVDDVNIMAGYKNYDVKLWITSPIVNSRFAQYLALISSPINSAISAKQPFKLRGFDAGANVTYVQPGTSRYAMNENNIKMQSAKAFFRGVRINNRTKLLEAGGRVGIYDGNNSVLSISQNYYPSSLGRRGNFGEANDYEEDYDYSRALQLYSHDDSVFDGRRTLSRNINVRR